MKKIYLFVAAICVLSVSHTFAQFEKGRILAGISSGLQVTDPGASLMNLGLGRIKYKEDGERAEKGPKEFNINLLPRAAYFVMDNLAVGLDLQVYLNVLKDRTTKGSNYVNTFLAAGPFVRYYYPLEKIHPFAEANMGLGISRTLDSSDGENGFLYGVGIGAALPLGENLMLDGQVGFSSNIWKDVDPDKKQASTKYIYNSFGGRVGFILLFGKGK
ncbi:MAG TPA: hypothetical protein PLZ75_00155 [Bacteroidales bacterium]|jgi:hypothetical protein|nr:hypothetical protein [Bacteroidales bacterium]